MKKIKKNRLAIIITCAIVLVVGLFFLIKWLISDGETGLLSFNVPGGVQLRSSKKVEKDSIVATASLESSGKKKAYYNVYFVIEENEFDELSDVVLKITDPDGNYVNEITGLKENDNLFEVGGKKGAFLIKENYKITSGKQTWRALVSIMNTNGEKKLFKGRLYIGLDEPKL